MSIFCSSCQHFRALPDGHKTPAGKPICNRCQELFLTRQSAQHKSNVKQSSKKLKTKPNAYIDAVLKRCATGD